MPNRAHGLRATVLAIAIAVAGTTAIVSPVAAIDPVPVESPSPTPDPTTVPSASPTTAPTASPETVAAPAVAAPAVVPNIGLRVARIALAQRGDQYRWGSQGPYYFDCSGLVRYSYRKAGVSAKLGGGNSARGMLYWARLHGLTSPRNPRVGDVAIYGGGSHAGIWIGNGRVVHALNPRLDILVTRLHAVTKPFTTFIHTRIPRG